MGNLEVDWEILELTGKIWGDKGVTGEVLLILGFDCWEGDLTGDGSAFRTRDGSFVGVKGVYGVGYIGGEWVLFWTEIDFWILERKSHF